MANVTSDRQKVPLGDAARTVRDAWAELFGLGIDPDAERRNRAAAGAKPLRLPTLTTPQQQLFAALRYPLQEAIANGFGGITATNEELGAFADVRIPREDGASHAETTIRNIKSDWKAAVRADVKAAGSFRSNNTIFEITFEHHTLQITVTAIAGTALHAPLAPLGGARTTIETDPIRETRIESLAGEFQTPSIRERIRRGWRKRSTEEIREVADELKGAKSLLVTSPKRGFRRYQAVIALIFAGACALGVADVLRRGGFWRFEGTHGRVVVDATTRGTLRIPGEARETRAIDDPDAGITIRATPVGSRMLVSWDATRLLERLEKEHGHAPGSLELFMSASPASGAGRELRFTFGRVQPGGWTYPYIYAARTTTGDLVFAIVPPFYMPPSEALRARTTLTLPDGTTDSTDPDAITNGTMYFVSRSAHRLPAGTFELRGTIDHPTFGPLYVTQVSRLDAASELVPVSLSWEVPPSLLSSGRLYTSFE